MNTIPFTPHDFASKLEKHEVLVGCRSSRAFVAPDLHRKMSVAGEKFGFSYREVTDSTILPGPLGARIAHLIYMADGQMDAKLERLIETCLTCWSSMSVAFRYPSDAAFAESANEIECLKSLLGTRVNFLRPVRTADGYWEVPTHKLVDNAVCDSVRVKFTPHCAGEIPAIPSGVERFFRESSATYRDYALYHRSPSDGFFAIRAGSSESFWITATKTDKIALDPARIALIHAYDRCTNTMRYRGRFLPSSDSVEAATVFAALPSVRALVHTHASRLFTRNPKCLSRVIVPALPYGEPELGCAVVQALKKVDDGFIIMDDHGEVFALGEPGAFKQRLAEFAAAYR